MFFNNMKFVAFQVDTYFFERQYDLCRITLTYNTIRLSTLHQIAREDTPENKITGNIQKSDERKICIHYILFFCIILTKVSASSRRRLI